MLVQMHLRQIIEEFVADSSVCPYLANHVLGQIAQPSVVAQPHHEWQADAVFALLGHGIG